MAHVFYCFPGDNCVISPNPHILLYLSVQFPCLSSTTLSLFYASALGIKCATYCTLHLGHRIRAQRIEQWLRASALQVCCMSSNSWCPMCTQYDSVIPNATSNFWSYCRQLCWTLCWSYKHCKSSVASVPVKWGTKEVDPRRVLPPLFDSPQPFLLFRNTWLGSGLVLDLQAPTLHKCSYPASPMRQPSSWPGVHLFCMIWGMMPAT